MKTVKFPKFQTQDSSISMRNEEFFCLVFYFWGNGQYEYLSIVVTLLLPLLLGVGGLMIRRHPDVFQRNPVTCWFSCINSTSFFFGSPRSAPAACLTLKESIYNSEHLLRIPREERLVWAAPDLNLASQLQFPNLSSRLSERERAAFTFAACQRASVRPPAFQRVNSGCVRHHKSRS